MNLMKIYLQTVFISIVKCTINYAVAYWELLVFSIKIKIINLSLYSCFKPLISQLRLFNLNLINLFCNNDIHI